MIWQKADFLELAQWGTQSLKAALLMWLVPGLLVGMGGSLLWSVYSQRTQVDEAYDRALAGALRAINYNISTASGGLSVEQPYLLLEFFELTVNGRVYFRVATEDGLVEIGNPGLPLPDGELEPDVPQFYDAMYLGEPIRVAAWARLANPPVSGNPQGRIIVQVAENLQQRALVERRMVANAILRDMLLVAISVVLLVAGVVRALRPLKHLRQRLDARAWDDLSPIDAASLPAEVRPLVQSLNLLVERYAHSAAAQRQFLDDASHQLRTPLALLRTQMGYALRERDPAEIRAALHAMQDGLGHAERLTQQMLALARARDAGAANSLRSQFAHVDVVVLAEEVVATLWPLARAKQIDLGLELNGFADGQERRLLSVEWLLREAISNLVDNAIRYTPRHGQVTLQVIGHATSISLVVIDSGGGMSDHDRERAGSRFRRGAAGKHQQGAGLGLAIVQTIAGMHGAELTLSNGHDAHGKLGLHCRFQLPRAASDLGITPK
ncbi:sensor histidine kinase N-terminal domain-containing protein [Comamonas sp.]|uniref:sensor histidine kinase n=1 Tax=Comamonas sp. TaxID=34028 RepID=UPI0028A26681|nr:sensor histidine kinase N-terminal domain-containing protein [Comamonas sp.]